MGSNSTTINVGSTIAASAGGTNNQFHVRKLDILSETGALHAGRHAVEAIGNSSAGGLLLGVTSTSATVGNTESVVSQLVNGTKIGTADRYSGQISVSSSSNVDQRAESNAAAGGLIGAGEARATANSNTTSNALIGDVTVYAGQMSVDAGGNSYSNATTEAGSGGLVAASGARPLVDMDANVKAQVSDGADINIHEQQYYEDLYAAAYDALSAGYGDEFDQRTDDQIIDLIKLSYTDAEFNALSQSDIDTKLAAAKTAEERVGFIARQYLELGQTKDQYIAAQITETLKTGANEVTGTFSINAQHTARPDAYVITESYGLIGGSGADSDINVNSTVTAKIGTGTNVGAMVKADHISILASNQVDKQAPADLNIDGNAGGLVAGASASSATVLTLNTLVDIGANSLIETVFESKSAALTEPGSVVIKALNSITFRDEVALFTGGALSGAGAFTTLSSTVLVAKINVGLDAQVRSKGEIIMETNAAGDVYLQSYSETNGLGSVALGDAVINLRPTSEINVYGTVRALKDIYLTAGTDRYQDLGSSTFKARVDNVAGSLIPISDLETQIRWIMTNNVVIHDQGHLQGANNISLFANDIAFGNLDAKAKGTNWMSAIGDAIDAIADSGSVEFGPGSGVALGVGQVINNGIIETGIARQKRIVIEGVKETGKSTFNKYIAQALDSDGDIKGEITFTKTDVGGVPQFVKATTDFADIPTDVRAEQPETDFDLDLVFEVVTSNLFSQYEAAVQNRARYETAGNDDLLAFYNTEIKRLGEEMLDKGEAIEQKDSNGNKIYENGNVVITPRPAQVPILKVKPITAAAGFVTVFSDHLLGDGTFKSPKDVTLEIISKTDAYLEIEGAVIPDITGGVIFNDLDVSEQLVNAEANRKIGLLNDKAIQNDNARLTKIEGGSVSGVNVSVSPISIAGQTLDLKLSDETYGQRSTLPKILIEVGYDAVGQLLQQQRLVYDVSTDADGNEVRTIQNNSDGSPALEDIPGVSETVTTWPNIIISGDVLNLQGNVVIDNNSSVSVDSAGITAIATIRDATFGAIRAEDAILTLKGDDTLSVRDIVVAEGGDAIFDITGEVNQVLKLNIDPSGKSANVGIPSYDSGGVLTNDIDVSSEIEISHDGGASWSAYSAASGVAVGASGTIKAKVIVLDEGKIDDFEYFSLVISKEGSEPTRLDTVGLNGNSSSKGDIKVADGVTINAKNLYQRTQGSLFIGGPSSDLIMHVAGDEYSKWKTGDLTGGGLLNGGTKNADANNGGAGISTYLNTTVSRTSPSIEASRVYIDVASLNINGLIKSGEDTFNVKLNATTQNQIDRLRLRNFSGIQKLNTSSSDFQIYYDGSANEGKGAVIVTELNTDGGYVDISGKIYNTLNGKIMVNAGRPHITIENEMTYSAETAPTIVIQKLDASTLAPGKLIIKDESRKANGDAYTNVNTANTDPYVVLYQVNDDELIEKSVAGADAKSLEALYYGAQYDAQSAAQQALKTRVQFIADAIAGQTTRLATDSYDLRAGMRYGWTIAQDSTIKTYYEKTTGSWLGIDAFVGDVEQLPQVSRTIQPGRLIKGSDYFFEATGSVADNYIYTKDTENTLEPTSKRSKYSTRSTWYGTTYTTIGYDVVEGKRDNHTHTIRADRPIDIEFLGHDAGQVVVKGANSNILVQGRIDNDFGTTDIQTEGSITTAGGQIGGRIIKLDADKGIGQSIAVDEDADETVDDSVRFANVQLATSNDPDVVSYLDAKSLAGGVYLKNLTSGLVVNEVLAGGQRDVDLRAAGTIEAENTSSLITGGKIVLKTSGGDIGTSTSDRLVIDSGDLAKHTVTVEATGDVYLNEKAGDLKIYRIESEKSVSIDVTSGRILDAHTKVERDERAIAELQNGVWGDLGLTNSTAYANIESKSGTDLSSGYIDQFAQAFRTDLNSATVAGLTSTDAGFSDAVDAEVTRVTTALQSGNVSTYSDENAYISADQFTNYIAAFTGAYQTSLQADNVAGFTAPNAAAIAEAVAKVETGLRAGYHLGAAQKKIDDLITSTTALQQREYNGYWDTRRTQIQLREQDIRDGNVSGIDAGDVNFEAQVATELEKANTALLDGDRAAFGSYASSNTYLDSFKAAVTSELTTYGVADTSAVDAAVAAALAQDDGFSGYSTYDVSLTANQWRTFFTAHYEASEVTSLMDEVDTALAATGDEQTSLLSPYVAEFNNTIFEVAKSQYLLGLEGDIKSGLVTGYENFNSDATELEVALRTGNVVDDSEDVILIGYSDTTLVASTTDRYAAYSTSIETDLRADGVAEAEITSVLAAVSQGLTAGNVAQYSDFSAIITTDLTLKTSEEIFQSAIDAFVGSMKTSVQASSATKFNAGTLDYASDLTKTREDLISELAADWYLTFRAGDAAYDAGAKIRYNSVDQADAVSFYGALYDNKTDAEKAEAGPRADYIAASIQTVINTETEVYKNLDAKYKTYNFTVTQAHIDAATQSGETAPGTLNQSVTDVEDTQYAGSLTADEIAEITGSVKVWTEDELINAIGGGLLKPVTETNTSNEVANISATSITLKASDSVGKTSGQHVIKVSDGPLNDEDRLFLAAAERDDIFFLTTDFTKAVVEIQKSSDTAVVNDKIKRLDGGVWSADLVDQWIQLENDLEVTAANQTASRTSENVTENDPLLYYVESISSDLSELVLAAGAGKKSLTASEFRQAVSISAVAPDPRGVSTDVTASFIGSTVTTTASLDNADLTTLFKVGMKVIVSGDSDKSNRGNDESGVQKTPYTIASVSANSMVFSETISGTDGSDLSLKLDQYVDIFAIQIQLREDINVEGLSGSGRLDIDAGKQIFVGSKEALPIGQIWSGGEDVRLKTRGDITNALSSSDTNFKSRHLLLESGLTGGIGMADDVIFIDQTADGYLTARGQLGIYITERTGDIQVSTIYSASGDVRLTAPGNIVDALNTSFVNIEAGDIWLTSTGGAIGAAGSSGSAPNSLDIEARGNGSTTGAGLLTATAQGDIFIAEQSGDMNVRNVLSTAGSVRLEAAENILDAMDLVDPTVPSSGEDVDAASKKPQIDVLAHENITLQARGDSSGASGYIGEAGNQLDIDSRRGNLAGVVSVQSRSDTYLIETLGDLYLNTAEVLDANEAAFLTATEGSLVNAAVIAGAANVRGGRVYLFARDHIGAADNKILSAVSTLQSQSTTGDTHVDNTGALNLEGLDGANAQEAGGSIYTFASSPITQSSSIVAAGEIIIEANEDPNDASGPDNITIVAGVTLHSTGSTVKLLAGDDIIIESGATIKAAVDVEIRAAYQDAVTDSGQSITIDGDVEAGQNLIMTASEYDDNVNVSAPLIVGQNFTLDTGNGADTVVFGVADSGSSADILKTTTGSITIDLGSSDTGSKADNFTLHGNMVAETAVTLTSGDGADVLTVNGEITSNTDAIDINTGSDSDQFTVKGLIKAQTNVTLDTAAGSDIVTLGVLVGGIAQGGIETVAGTVKLDLGETTDGASDNNEFTLTGDITAYAMIDIDTGAGADVVTVNGTMTATTDIIDIDSGAGVDEITVTGTMTTDAAAIAINTGSDSDQFTVKGLIKAQTNVTLDTAAGSDIVTLGELVGGIAQGGIETVAGTVKLDLGETTDGASDNDQFTLIGDITSNVDIDFDSGAGADVVTVNGTMTTTTGAIDINTGSESDQIDIVGRLEAGTSFKMHTGSGEDDLEITGAIKSSGTSIEIDTGDTRDFVTITGDLEAETDVLIKLGAGDDSLDILNASVIANNSETRIEGEAGKDTIIIEDVAQLTGTTSILGGNNDDTITIVRLATQNAQTDSLLIDGGSGADDVFIQTWGSIDGVDKNYNINVWDTGAANDGSDTLDILGTAKDDFFLSREKFVALLHGTESQIRKVWTEAGDNRISTVERINYDRSMDGRVSLLGFDGKDHFVSDDNSAIMTFDGGKGDDTFQFGQIFGLDPRVANPATNGIAAGDEINAVLTTRGYLSRGVSFSSVAMGGEGADLFTIYSNKASIKLEGEAGNDSFVVRAFLVASGDDTAEDEIEISGGDGDDSVKYNINAPVKIDGGAGFDTVVVVGTEADDSFVVTENGVYGAGLNIEIGGAAESIEVDGVEGDDNFFILSTPKDAVTHIIGGLGSDQFHVTGDVTETIFAADVGGRSGLINHQAQSVTGNAYNNAFIPGVGVTVADAKLGKVLISQEVSGDATEGVTRVFESNGGTTDIYSVALAVSPVVGKMVYVTVSAARSSTSDQEEADRPLMQQGTAVSFMADGNVITRANGSWLDDGFDEFQSVVIGDAGDNNGVYEVATVTETQITFVADARLATTEADLTAITIEGQKASSILVRESGSGAEFTDATVLTFDSTNWDQAQTVEVRAQDDAAEEGVREVVINHSVMSDDDNFDAALVEDLHVTVFDDDQADIVIWESGTDTRILEGSVSEGVSDTWDVRLTRKPTHDVTVDLTDDSNSTDVVLSANTVTFDSTNWDQVQTITVSSPVDAFEENLERVTVSHTATSSDLNFNGAPVAEILVRVEDGDTAGAYITETGGRTLIVDGGTDTSASQNDEYKIRLRKQPTAEVKVHVYGDGQTLPVAGAGVTIEDIASTTLSADFQSVQDDNDLIVRAAGSWIDDGFLAGQTLRVSGTSSNNKTMFISDISDDEKTIVLATGSNVTDEATSADFLVKAGVVTFNAQNWYQEVTVSLEPDPDFEPTATSYVTKKFAAEPHTTSKIQGSLIIDGGVTAPRTLVSAVMLPSEQDTGPIDVDVSNNEAFENDRVYVHNDGSQANDTGEMKLVSDVPNKGLANVGTDAVLINGLGMSTGQITFNEGTDDAPIMVAYYEGIAMRTIEIIEVMLGKGDDNFTVTGNNAFSDNTQDVPITAIHGGGGGDTITIKDGDLSNPPETYLVVYGDTSADGSRYNYLGGAPNGGALVFDGLANPDNHNDTIDASAYSGGATGGLVLFGGVGDDTIRGSQGADHIAGGSSDDDIHGNSGDDHIYGDGGFNVDLLTRTLTVAVEVDEDPKSEAVDTLNPGNDTIEGNDGVDIIFGDLGRIDQVAGTIRIANTGFVERIISTETGLGGNDDILGGRDIDYIIGGAGDDTVDGGADNNIVFGDAWRYPDQHSQWHASRHCAAGVGVG